MTILALGQESLAQVQFDTTLADILLRDTASYKRTYVRRPLAWEPEVSKPGNVLKVENVLYFVPDQYGIVYRIRTNGDFLLAERMDSTRFAGMTGGQYCFFENGIYGFGGYGFWQTNGQLRAYVLERGEWEIVKLNEVLPSYNFFTYYDPGQKLLWCAQQDYVNEVLESGTFRRVNDVYRLSPYKRTWEKVGRLNYTSTNTTVHEGIYVETPYGVLINSGGPKFEIWNFALNRRFDLGPLSDSIRAYFIPTWGNGNHSLVYAGSKIHIYDHQIREIFKSFELKPDQLKPLPEKVYSTSGLAHPLIWVLPILFVPISVLAYRKWVRRRPDSGVAVNRVETHADPSGNDGMHTGHSFSRTAGAPVNTNRPVFADMLTNLEKEILHKVASDTINGQRTSQDELNRMLGTERRSADIQKRHRSDILKSINDKFQQANATHILLIERARSSEDQRLFEYYINPIAGYTYTD